MSTTTTNYGLIKPGTDDPILVGQLNDNMDTIDTVLKDHSDKIDAASLGIKYKGEVNYYADLPNNAEIGDAYTVKYAGSSGTTPDGTEYVWGTVSGTNQWINFSKDSYTKAEVDALLALKVDTAGTGLSKSGTTLNHSNSTTAKTTQGFAQIAHDAQGHITGSTAATTAQTNAINSGIDSTKVAQIETNKNNILYNTNNGVKNVASLKTSVSTGNADVTFVQNADKSYTLTISAAMSTNLAFDISETFKLDSSIQYVLSGNPSSGAIRLVFAEGTAPFSWIDQQYGNNPVTITPVADKMYKLSLFIYANTSATTLTLKPMVCAKSLYDSDTTYQPYAMSNAELTAAIQAIQAQLANQ